MKYFKVENARSQACTARPFRKGACLIALRKMKRCLLSGCFTTSGKLSGPTKFDRRQIPDCLTTSGISIWSKDLSIESADTSLSKVNWVFWRHFRLHVLKGTGSFYAGSISQLNNSQLNNLPEEEQRFKFPKIAGSLLLQYSFLQALNIMRALILVNSRWTSCSRTKEVTAHSGTKRTRW